MCVAVRVIKSASSVRQSLGLWQGLGCLGPPCLHRAKAHYWFGIMPARWKTMVVATAVLYLCVKRDSS